MKSVLPLHDVAGRTAWQREPAVCGYQRVTHQAADGRTIPVPVCGTPAIVTGAGVVVAGYDGSIRFHNRTLDRVFWERRLDGAVYASLVVDADRRTIVVATVKGVVTCVDLRGRTVWSTDTGLPLYATPSLVPASGLVVFATFHSKCVALDLLTGSRMFVRDLPRPWSADYGGSAVDRDPYASPVVTEDGNIVVCCAEHVLCLAPDGREVWRTEIGHAVRASPAILPSRGEVAVCAVNGHCFFLDTGSGEVRWEVRLGGKITASPAVSAHVLAVGTRSGVSFGVDAGRREVIWSSASCSPRDHTSFSVLPDGEFVATAERGNVVALRRDDGGFLWETDQLLGLAEHDPALDTTPVASPDGSMYCGSYSGWLYHLRFPPTSGEG